MRSYREILQKISCIYGLLGVAFMFPALPAMAQNCSAPQTQIEYTECAAKAYKVADGALNQAYKRAQSMAKGLDAGLAADETPSATMLRDAQRSWITYRDQACKAESMLARGGTMQNQLLFICLERLTWQRTDDLCIFAQEY